MNPRSHRQARSCLRKILAQCSDMLTDALAKEARDG